MLLGGDISMERLEVYLCEYTRLLVSAQIRRIVFTSPLTPLKQENIHLIYMQLFERGIKVVSDSSHLYMGMVLIKRRSNTGAVYKVTPLSLLLYNTFCVIIQDSFRREICPTN